jgi:hypothetical protein
MYYIDIVAKIKKDERAGIERYKGIKLVIPFAYWMFPPRDKSKRKKRKVKPKNTKSNEKK